MEYEDVSKSQECCENCRFYVPIIYEFDYQVDDTRSKDWGVTDCGECRRFPPKANKDSEAIFPVVNETNWCGEFDL